jgi:glycosyltransferase involved in cell wall biosynthesis
MSQSDSPRVSIVTPVYNGEEHLAECIESVLRQTYAHWDYTIVDNCSTDGSLAIMQRYASSDRRIRVVQSNQYLPIIPNHNRALREIPTDSKYCKFVFADDLLFPKCIDEMVHLAERNPSVGMVGAYGTDGNQVLWTGIGGSSRELQPADGHQTASGREICRSKLLGGPYLFGSMTSLLIRSDLIRNRPVFFNNQNLHADQEVCFDLLQESDFGFVHQVLTFTRPREASQSAFAKDFDSIILGDFVILLKYGPVFLSDREFQQRLEEMRREYHRVLARNVLRRRPAGFWKYHRDTLGAFGSDIDRWLLVRLVLSQAGRALSHPGRALAKAWQTWVPSFGKAPLNSRGSKV